MDVFIRDFHGIKYRHDPVKGSRNMIEALKKAGASPRYLEFAEVGHAISKLVNETPSAISMNYLMV